MQLFSFFLLFGMAVPVSGQERLVYEADLLGRHERTGRPLGLSEFAARLAKLLNRALAPCKLGRKSKAKSASTSS